jgi:hypothetical protein
VKVLALRIDGGLLKRIDRARRLIAKASSLPVPQLSRSEVLRMAIVLGLSRIKQQQAPKPVLSIAKLEHPVGLVLNRRVK